MDIVAILEAIKAYIENVDLDNVKAWGEAGNALMQAKAHHPEAFQLALDNLDQIISYYSQNPEGTAHNA